MNEQPTKYLAPGQDVLVIGHDKKPHRAKIIEVIVQTGVQTAGAGVSPAPATARVESLDGKNSAIAHYSETGEINTFRFPEASSSAVASAKTEAEADRTKEAKNK